MTQGRLEDLKITQNGAQITTVALVAQTPLRALIEVINEALIDEGSTRQVAIVACTMNVTFSIALFQYSLTCKVQAVLE